MRSRGDRIGGRATGRDRKKARKRAVLILLLFLLLLGATDLILPAEVSQRLVGRPLIGLYRAVSGLVHEHDCPSHPSCSAYALKAFGRHGIFMGTLLTTDRLLGEADRMEEGPWVWIKGRRYVDDPLAANTFWWPR